MTRHVEISTRMLGVEIVGFDSDRLVRPPEVNPGAFLLGY